MNGKREIMAEKSNFLLRWRSLVSENQSDVQWLWPINSHHFTSFYHGAKLIIWCGQRGLANKRDASLHCCTCYAELMSYRFAYGHFCVHLTRIGEESKYLSGPLIPESLGKQSWESEGVRVQRIRARAGFVCKSRVGHENTNKSSKHVFSLICESINIARATHFLRRPQLEMLSLELVFLGRILYFISTKKN